MKIGVLGVGRIVELVIPTLNQMQTANVYAVASRTLAKAEDFAKRHGIEKAYGSYEELVKDPDVQLIYIATPHSHHYEHMMLCIDHGKNVICEKAFTLNAEQAKKIQSYAKEKGVYVAEAIWTRYMPSRSIIQQVIDSGIIGRPSTLTANLCYPITEKQRILDPSLAGGALLDIGVYGINFSLMHFGDDIERVESSVQFTPSGVDGMESITIFYKDGRMAVLTHSIYARSDRKGIIYGDKGYIIVENINNPQSISVFDLDDKLIACHEVPAQISGYEYEFQESMDAIQAGKLESSSMPLAQSVYVMEFMDNLRKQWGLVYPQEQ